MIETVFIALVLMAAVSLGFAIMECFLMSLRFLAGRARRRALERRLKEIRDERRPE